MTRFGNHAEMTRRHFIAAVGVGGFGAWLTACSGGADNNVLGPVTPSGTPFVEPEILTSSDGLLEVTLRAAPTDIPWRDTTRYAYTYNGSSPGPTLRLRPGDLLVVHLENGLDEDTNLHTHGLHVSPEGDADNIFATVPPGQSRTYRYDIPLEHRSGLFWYHPHAHGTVAKQVAAGLAGAIVVVDQIDDLPEIAASIERLWILSDPPIGIEPGILNAGAMDAMTGRTGDAILINGIERPDVKVEAGTRQRWRIVNASASRYYRLAVDNHQLQLIASDGGRLSAPVQTSEILLAPGERTEFLINPTSPGTFAVRALPYDRGTAGMGGSMMGDGMMGGDNSTATEDIVIATMTVSGRSNAASLPTSLLDPTSFAAPSPDSSRVFELGEQMGAMMGGGSMMSFTINGQTFDANRTDVSVALNTVEEWEIRNPTHMDHPIHLHVWPFLVVDAPAGSGWKDTINVPAGESVRIIVPFTGIVGRTVYHCHILDHEDLGMMGVIEVAS